jgi:hypothetical protein
MPAGLVVDAHPVRAGVGKGLDEVVGILDHHVAIEGQVRGLAQRLYDRRTQRQVGDEVPVHYVDVDDRPAASLSSLDFLAETGEVRRQNRWKKLDQDDTSLAAGWKNGCYAENYLPTARALATVVGR